jgi:hypothetical protein
MLLSDLEAQSPYAASALRLWAFGDSAAPLPAFAPFLALHPQSNITPDILSLNYDGADAPRLICNTAKL